MTQTPSPMPTAAAVIPTFNRKDLLRECVASFQKQTVPVEIIVLDDGSTDGTAEMMRTEFPQVRYQRFQGLNGPAFLRNRGAALATAEFLFPVDDDSVLVSPHTVAQTLAEFDDPRIAAVGIPFINVRQNQQVQQIAPSDDACYVAHTFVGCAHAIRREVFLSVGGFRAQLFYMGEEGDLTLRLLDRGYVTRVGRADPIHHHESPSRSRRRADVYGRRNDILHAWHNVPWPYLPVHLLATTLNGIRFGFRAGAPRYMCEGLLRGYGAVLSRECCQRRPVSRQTYRLYRELRKIEPVKLERIGSQLPALQPPIESLNR